MQFSVEIIGGGLAGSEAALQLAQRGVKVRLFEMRPCINTPVHHTDRLAELVCSNSLKSTKPESAAGMLKHEMCCLGSRLYGIARSCSVPAGGALAVNRITFADAVTDAVMQHPLISVCRAEKKTLSSDADALIVATGPLTSDAFAHALSEATGKRHLSFYDAAAPIVSADSLDQGKLFRQSRYEEGNVGDYLNAPFNKQEYDAFIEELIKAERVVPKEFETQELFQACQPIEEIARRGKDAPRFGSLKPVGLTDPLTDRRPWATLQLRAENEQASCFNLVGFQTNLTFAEQRRVFRMIPGLEHAEFLRYGVMHRNTFVDAPRVLDATLRMKAGSFPLPVYIAGQLAGTEGYCEAIMSGLFAALSVYGRLTGAEIPPMPRDTAFGSLLAYATDETVEDYQPMHVNFGIIEPLSEPVKNKKARYAAYASRGNTSLQEYRADLRGRGLLVD